MHAQKADSDVRWIGFIRLRLNTLQLAEGMKGKVNRAEAL